MHMTAKVKRLMFHCMEVLRTEFVTDSSVIMIVRDAIPLISRDTSMETISQCMFKSGF